MAKKKLWTGVFIAALLLVLGAATALGPTDFKGIVRALVGLSANGMTTPQIFGAKGDTVTLKDGAISSGTNVFTSATASFTSADVGKAIVVTGAAAAGNALVTTIASFVSSTSVTLSVNAGTTVSAALVYYGTDDTAAIKSCIANGTAVGKRCWLTDGMTFMMSNSTNTATLNGTGPGGILDGTGTVIFAPTGTITGGINDRFLYIKSTESAAAIQVAAGAIAKGATSFTANASGDVATWVKGDWIVLCEHDPGFGDCLYVDWAQVSSVSVAVVNIVTPFRMAFPNARTWNVSGTPANCNINAPCGLSARKITNITNATLKDFHLIVVKVPGVAGIGIRETRGVTMDNITIDSASQNAFFTYLDQGLNINKVRINNGVSSEIAGTVDFSVTQLQSQMIGTRDNGFAGIGAACLTIDIGSGFGTMADSNCGPTLNSAIFLNGGVHDSTFTGNTVGWLNGASPGAAFQVLGGYNNRFAANTLSGGGGSAFGFNFSDTSGYTVNVSSDNNRTINNSVNNFPSANANAYGGGGALGTDSGGEPGEYKSASQTAATATANGVITNVATLPLTYGEWDITASAYFAGTSTNATQEFLAISTSSSSNLPALFPCGAGCGDANNYGTAAYTLLTQPFIVVVQPFKVNITATGTTNYFLNEVCLFGTGTCGAQGAIRARRIR